MHIALFTRWPTPGEAKTRLIPALGADGAAALHKRLTERTVAVVLASGLPLEIRSTGAPPADFAAWLSPRHAGKAPPPVTIIDQGTGTLGDRLSRAAQTCPVLLLGADIPGLAPGHLIAAAAALAKAPAVIGPATDGGYWLLGLATALPQAFQGIDWGSDTVLAETLARLPQDTPQLETLSDLDTPEDLARWPGL